jgi:hypothetical protein
MFSGAILHLQAAGWASHGQTTPHRLVAATSVPNRLDGTVRTSV